MWSAFKWWFFFSVYIQQIWEVKKQHLSSSIAKKCAWYHNCIWFFNWYVGDLTKEKERQTDSEREGEPEGSGDSILHIATKIISYISRISNIKRKKHTISRTIRINDKKYCEINAAAWLFFFQLVLSYVAFYFFDEAIFSSFFISHSQTHKRIHRLSLTHTHTRVIYVCITYFFLL